MVVTLLSAGRHEKQRPSGDPHFGVRDQRGAPSPCGARRCFSPLGSAVHRAALGHARERRPSHEPHRVAGAVGFHRKPDAVVRSGAGFRHTNLGGPRRHGGHLVFVGGTMDRYLRASISKPDANCGSIRSLRWPGHPHDVSRRQAERQYVVIAAGATGRSAAAGRPVVAFALPQESVISHWILGLSILIQVLLIVHCIKTTAIASGSGRSRCFHTWASSPHAAELLPDLFRSRTAQRAGRNMKKALDPHADLRRSKAKRAWAAQRREISATQKSSRARAL